MTGTGRLLRLILRRDRVILPLWVLLLGILPQVYLAGFQKLFTTDAERLEYAHVSAANAGFTGLYGPLSGDSLGELVVWRAGFVPVMIALAALLTVIRHTRAEEEAGRSDLIRATVVGRWAQLTAALLVTALACLVIGLLVTGSMIGAGEPVEGSVAFGALFTLSGWLFAGVAAIAAQLTSSARGARMIAVLVLGVAYVLRMGGDISAAGDGRLDWLAWLSPLGWVQKIVPFGADDWAPAVLALLVAVAAVAVAGVLLTRRDLGAGLLASRLGPAHAGAGLASPLGLAWRLHRGLLLGWTAGFAALGVVFGGVGTSVVQLAETSSGVADTFAKIGGTGSITDAYFASTTGICALIVAIYAIQAALRIRDEEQNGHAELILTTAVSRTSWAASHLLFALLGPALAMVAQGALAGATFGDLGPVLGAAVAQLPAVWVLGAVTVLLIGALPRYAALSWGTVAVSLLILLVGPLLEFPQWAMDVSPFTHVPQLPAASFSAVPDIVLILIALVIGGAGLVSLRRRDIPA
ncbi:ABC-2 type transport system permease protein [Actinoplanes octamycinicus]|uniref:ABC-2 type transport system permease protein n=1 Tax=Actinoplanes octamycinicus TaxID=135948 RepID=A0A7W7GUP9_9ACTN|nr:ABC transporter permease [Actinoplanes octamycinicus]MBB4738658.1 ABC-2 type transport system permease protein [Actinoplanes octamycinicus]GIE61391.1 exporter of polyketide antibiotics [Actinoplanes octamycinicus]